ncbi:hypothetical protein CBS63078_2112 [Aspergillus niger]|nr:hypothetical protein CBS133816_8602 [Aspergillus niger]KAI2844601.1 hypothetical protein CBS12448_9887 [Aspergillus niger]KAI2852900.1 hypothetical protein CBS11350_533 [Aspergillus niger]KAI2888341.1 hypothetical protein CBS13152_6427 [Aspergillus niger]KAI2894840.1 hypothetical protein CBS11852_4834 [Aspergillus niger]
MTNVWRRSKLQSCSLAVIAVDLGKPQLVPFLPRLILLSHLLLHSSPHTYEVLLYIPTLSSLPPPLLRSKRVLLLSDESRFVTGATAILVDTCVFSRSPTNQFSR